MKDGDWCIIAIAGVLYCCAVLCRWLVLPGAPCTVQCSMLSMVLAPAGGSAPKNTEALGFVRNYILYIRRPPPETERKGLDCGLEWTNRTRTIWEMKNEQTVTVQYI